MKDSISLICPKCNKPITDIRITSDFNPEGPKWFYEIKCVRYKCKTTQMVTVKERK